MGEVRYGGGVAMLGGRLAIVDSQARGEVSYGGGVARLGGRLAMVDEG
jgi:hypothetical protein